MSVADYQARIVTEKWCTGCKAWHLRGAFKADASRSDGLASTCSMGRASRHVATYVPRASVSRRGMLVVSATRDGDKKQARMRVNHEVQTGARPHPNTLPCTDCGHVWEPGERRHEYDHHLGYAAARQLDVQPVCVECHRKRDSAKKNQTHCLNGHEFTAENTYIKPNGCRSCKACRREADKRRRPKRAR
jgi:hypothetical protein